MPLLVRIVLVTSAWLVLFFGPLLIDAYFFGGFQIVAIILYLLIGLVVAAVRWPLVRSLWLGRGSRSTHQ
jgi:hypothetical protein